MGLTPSRIAIAYIVVAAAWILLSDAVVAALPASATTWAGLSVVKGWGFVAVTGSILYLLVRRLARDVARERDSVAMAEASLAGVAASLRLVVSAQDAVMGATTEADVLRMVCEALVADGRLRFAWAGVARPDRTVAAVARAGEDAGYLDGLDVRWDDSPLGRDPTGIAVLERRSVVMEDIATDERAEPWRARALAAGFRASAAVPIADADALHGVLNVYAAQAGSIDPGHIAEIERVARETGYAIRAIRARTDRDDAIVAEIDAGRELAAANERYARLVAEAPLSIVVTDLDGTVLEWNAASERLWRLPAERAVGTFAPWILPDERAAFLTFVADVAAGARTAGVVRARHRGDGTQVIVRTANAPIVDADGTARILWISEEVAEAGPSRAPVAR